MAGFELVTDYQPRGDQPRAIAELVEGVLRGDAHQTLLGVTGSGKTFTMAQRRRPGAAADAGHRPQQDPGGAALRRVQGALSQERRRVLHQLLRLLPARGVRPLVGHVHREGLVHQRRDRADAPLGHPLAAAPATTCIIVASVSCIYGLGTARSYVALAVARREGRGAGARRASCGGWSTRSTSATTSTSTAAPSACAGDTVEVFPAYEEERAVRIEFFGDTVESITEFDPLRGQYAGRAGQDGHLPRQPLRHRGGAARAGRPRHPRRAARAAAASSAAQDKLLEAQRLEQRTMYDLEMMEQVGFCNGIENYSRHLSGRAAGRAAALPARLLPEEPPGLHRREPPDRAADRRDVPRRPEPQGDAGGVRLPAALGAWTTGRCKLRRVRGRWCPRRSTSAPRRASTSCSRATGWWWSRSSAPPA